MSMRELLRIEMSVAQVKEACEAWTFDRSALDAATTDGVVALDADGASVTFIKKRSRKPRTMVNLASLKGSATTLCASPLPAATQVEIERFHKGDRQ